MQSNPPLTLTPFASQQPAPPSAPTAPSQVGSLSSPTYPSPTCREGAVTVHQVMASLEAVRQGGPRELALSSHITMEITDGTRPCRHEAGALGPAGPPAGSLLTGSWERGQGRGHPGTAPDTGLTCEWQICPEQGVASPTSPVPAPGPGPPWAPREARSPSLVLLTSEQVQTP